MLRCLPLRPASAVSLRAWPPPAPPGVVIRCQAANTQAHVLQHVLLLLLTT